MIRFIIILFGKNQISTKINKWELVNAFLVLKTFVSNMKFPKINENGKAILREKQAKSAMISKSRDPTHTK